MPRTFGITNLAPYAAAPAVGSAGDTYYNTASKVLYLSDGSVWNPDKAGVPAGGIANAVLTKNSATDFDTGWTSDISDIWARATNTVGQVIPQTTYTTLVFNSVDAGSTGFVGTTGIFTAPRSATYLLIAHCNFGGQTTAQTYYASVYKLGAAYGPLVGFSAPANNGPSLELTCMVRAAANDTFSVRVSNNVVSGVTTNTGNSIFIQQITLR